MKEMMNCAIYYGIGDVRMEQRPIPEIGPDDILVKNLRAGICGSDTGAYLHGGEAAGIFKGQQFGHEMTGKVVKKGENVTCVEVGDIIFAEPNGARKAGTIMADMLGAFSEYLKVENPQIGENIFVLDPNIDLDAAVVIEPLSVGTQSAICTNPKNDDKVVILGAGTIGLCAAAGLIARGAKHVVVVDRDQWRLEKAKEIGAKTINTSDEDLAEKLLAYFGPAQTGTTLDPTSLEPNLLHQIFEFSQKANLSLDAKKPDIDLVVDCAGALPLLQQAFNLSREGTKYVIVAVYHQDITLNANMFIMNQAAIRGSRAYTNETIAEVIDHITKEKTPIKTIVTRKFKHSDFPEAIKFASEANQCIKVVIDYEMA